MQNYPVLTSVQTSVSETTVTGSLNSTPSATFRIEFFTSPTGDASGFGEGQTYLDGTFVTTDASGNATFSFVLPIVPVDRCSPPSRPAAIRIFSTGTVRSSRQRSRPPTRSRPPWRAAPSSLICRSRALPHRLRYVFGENVSASLTPSDLVLQNLTTGQTVASGAIALA